MGEHVGTCSPIRGVWCRHPCPPGRNANPCSRLSAEVFTHRWGRGVVSQRDQQARAFLAGPEKISSVAFLLACTEGNSHPSTTGTPQLKAVVKHAGNAPIPPSLPLFFSISSSDLSILSTPWSPGWLPPPPKFLRGIPQQKGHRCHAWSDYYGVEACVSTDINLEEKSTVGRSDIVGRHQSVR